MLVGGAGLAMWDVASHQRLYKYPGHTVRHLHPVISYHIMPLLSCAACIDLAMTSAAAPVVPRNACFFAAPFKHRQPLQW